MLIQIYSPLYMYILFLLFHSISLLFQISSRFNQHLAPFFQIYIYYTVFIPLFWRWKQTKQKTTNFFLFFFKKFDQWFQINNYNVVIQAKHIGILINIFQSTSSSKFFFSHLNFRSSFFYYEICLYKLFYAWNNEWVSESKWSFYFLCN